MIDKLGWYLEPGEFSIKRNEVTKRCNLSDWKIESKAYKGQYFPNIIPHGQGINILTCPAKALYNHNLYEIVPNDFERFLDVTYKQLEILGIKTSKEILAHKTLSVIHFNKIVELPTTIDCCIRMLQTAEKYKKFTKGISVYPDDGICIFNTLKYRKLKFYDKTKEALKQTSAIDVVKELQKQNITLLQVEYQIQGTREIEREYKVQGIKFKNTLKNAFNPDISRTILYNRTKEALEHIYVIDIPEYQLLEKAEIICKQNNIHGPKAKSSIIGFLWICNKFGINVLLNLISNWSDPKTGYKIYKKIKNYFSILFDSKTKTWFQDIILSSIQHIGDKSFPQKLCNTTNASLSDETISIIKPCVNSFYHMDTEKSETMLISKGINNSIQQGNPNTIPSFCKSNMITADKEVNTYE